MSETKISLRPNGPIVIETTGPVTVIDVDGNPISVSAPRLFLCRCGASKDKPFCDGTHKSCGFIADQPRPKP